MAEVTKGDHDCSHTMLAIKTLKLLTMRSSKFDACVINLRKDLSSVRIEPDEGYAVRIYIKEG